MQAWLVRAAALGMTPDVVVPMPLLLPAPEATDRADDVVVGNFDGHALVRGAQLAFAGEPELAAHIVCERTVRELDTAATEAALAAGALSPPIDLLRSEEHTSELQSLMRISYAVFCLKKKNKII